MRWLTSLLVVVALSSCQNSGREVYKAVDDISNVCDYMEEIGERDHQGMRWYWPRYYNPIRPTVSGDSVTMSAEEFATILNDLYDIQAELENIYDTQNDFWKD